MLVLLFLVKLLIYVVFFFFILMIAIYLLFKSSPDLLFKESGRKLMRNFFFWYFYSSYPLLVNFIEGVSSMNLKIIFLLYFTFTPLCSILSSYFFSIIFFFKKFLRFVWNDFGLMFYISIYLCVLLNCILAFLFELKMSIYLLNLFIGFCDWVELQMKSLVDFFMTFFLLKCSIFFSFFKPYFDFYFHKALEFKFLTFNAIIFFLLMLIFFFKWLQWFLGVIMQQVKMLLITFMYGAVFGFLVGVYYLIMVGVIFTMTEMSVCGCQIDDFICLFILFICSGVMVLMSCMTYEKFLKTNMVPENIFKVFVKLYLILSFLFFFGYITGFMPVNFFIF